MIARACPRAIRLPRNPAVAASAMSAAIASGVVGIGNHLVVDRTYELGVAFHVEADPPLADLARVVLQGGGQQLFRGVAGEDEQQMRDALRRDAVLEQGIVDGVDERKVLHREQALRNERERMGRRKASVLFEAGAGFGENLGGERGAALGLRLEELKPLRL